ncbi:hypothetical protein [Streptomyces sp. AN091965]|uniref:hypothetical protein n=1 Tax=Streptomyces sp. AN091965 TaxID=2927803 RepID=UPI001F61D1DC|nr:hypothetical protein [Streptomyces sp. AN091965]MCI3928095.1 hypothetical protein [Streptomyces sp. AN091965]
MNERTVLRRAGLLGVIPLIVVGVALIMGRFPYPDDNVDGHEYLAYMLPRRLGEVQAILWSVLALSAVMFVAVLALAYRQNETHVQREKGVALSRVAMVAGAVMFAVLQFVLAALYEGATLFARGYPGFGSDPSDTRLITFVWGVINSTYTLSCLAMALVFLAIASANRASPLLPRALGGWAAITVAVVNVAAVGSVFVTTGKWSPGSICALGLQAAPTFLWMATAGAVLQRRAQTLPKAPRAVATDPQASEGKESPKLAG